MSEKRSASASRSSAIPERHHQAGQIDAPDHQEAGQKADHCGGKPGHHQRRHRLIDNAMQREQSGRIGADAEERGMAKRYDAGVAEDQVERQREQRQPQDFRHDEIARGKQKRAGQHEKPERQLAIAPACGAPGVKSNGIR